MLFAVDTNNNRVHIDDAIITEEYFCPCCGDRLVIRKGDIRMHHFAHSKENSCSDNWHYDMTEWHYNWQNKFPKEFQEVVKVYDGEKHRADVLIEDKKIVYEFQHSNISSVEFEERNDFYTRLGYNVVWIFDVEEQYQNNQIDNYKKNLWNWKYARKTFEGYDYKNSNVSVYLQFDNSEVFIIKVTWNINNKGLSIFATDGYVYDESEFMLNSNEPIIEKNEYRISELYDELIELYSKDHTTYYGGCPISTSHKCADCIIDIPTSEFSVIMPCEECSYNENRGMVCNKRFKELKISGDPIVNIEERDPNGFVKKISYLKNGKRVFLDVPVSEVVFGDSILKLWNRCKCDVAIFKNDKTGWYAQINKDPNQQYRNYRKVYGKISKDRYGFASDSCEIYGADRKEWILMWYK